ncbi:unnamed protein product [Rotaria sordida]|uniref:Lipase domain-containing protein n=2 Tax=Rotaria sordida TaxID=392033 RepID=A0A814VIQ0_9BILA|nr:unnamed protein product [Rotaria sordida]CAF1202579.1 unnamed protein product [Rotaria sordida]
MRLLGGTLERPIALLPQSPSTVLTRFFLYTREHRDAVEIGRQKTNLGLGTWRPDRMTRVIIHGMIENYQAPWYDQMRQAFLDTEDSNLIFVDWSKTNHFPYTQATANTQMVGAEVSLLINELIAKHGADPQLIHLIGHSLGAHAAGYAGSRIVPRVSRITGLDPAGPNFERTDPRVRLDPTDAQFVDVIHTDGQAHIQLGLGLLQPLGHVDFYPNGGLEQPQCPKMGGKIWNTIINAFDNDGNTKPLLVNYCSHRLDIPYEKIL